MYQFFKKFKKVKRVDTSYSTMEILNKIYLTSDIILVNKLVEKLPQQIREKESTKRGIWNSKELTCLNKEFTHLLCMFDKILVGNGGHWMETPQRFWGDFHSFIRGLMVRVKLRIYYVKYVCNQIFLNLYNEVRYKPGMSGFLEAQKHFESIKLLNY
jgi:hypothetical protein